MGMFAGPERSDSRWKQRFDNLQRAYRRLRWALEMSQSDPDSDLIRMAVIKAYEFTFELSWKTLKDYLAYSGIDVRLPREVIKQGFACGLITDGQLWIDMLAKQAVEQIQQRYLSGLAQLHDLFVGKLQESDPEAPP